ncbi:MAG: DUF4331 domain-containing protein [Caldilineaceae bacterium]
MNPNDRKPFLTHVMLALCLVMTPVLLMIAALTVQRERAEASSHREAPLISQDPFADNTDTYVFISPTNPDNLVLVASWIPFEGPEGGPNYFEWGNGVLYNINVDNNGDAVADYTYTLSSQVDVQNPLTFLYNVGPIGADGSNWNRQQRITVTEKSAQGAKTLLDNALAPPVNIGSKSTPNYDDLEDNFIYTVNDNGDQIKIYAGQTDDAFWVDLQVFDLLTLRGQQPPIGYSTGNNTPVDSVAGFNNHSLVIELPISRLTQGNEPVLGVWATAERPSTRVLNGPSGLGTLDNSGDPVQVSRLGMPLVNEVVLPLALKDAFNSIAPSTDAVLYTGGAGATIQSILQKSVEDPEIGRLLCGLYGVPLPGDLDKDCSTEVTVGTPRSGRGDIFDIFLTGMVLASDFTVQTKNGPATLPAGTNVNQPANVTPAEMIRINTAIKGDLCSPMPSRLGVLGGDACGFPNGRRLTDDVVEIELLAVAGAAYGVLDGRDSDFTFNPALIDILTDGIDGNDRPFRHDFPYMAQAQSGQEHIHTNPTAPNMMQSTASMIADDDDDAEERGNGTMKLGSHDLDFGEDHHTEQTVGLRFTNVEIPAGATITKAYVQLVAEDSDDDETMLHIYGEATDDAARFSKERHNLSQRTPTNAQVAWSVPAWQRHEKYWTPDLSSVLQEIVGRSGWVAGNDLVILFKGTGDREAWSYDGAPEAAPLLYVEYSTTGMTAANADAMNQATNIVSSSVLAPVQFDSTKLVPFTGTDEDDLDGSDTGASAPGEETTQAGTLYLPLVTE